MAGKELDSTGNGLANGPSTPSPPKVDWSTSFQSKDFGADPPDPVPNGVKRKDHPEGDDGEYDYVEGGQIEEEEEYDSEEDEDDCTPTLKRRKTTEGAVKKKPRPFNSVPHHKPIQNIEKLFFREDDLEKWSKMTPAAIFRQIVDMPLGPRKDGQHGELNWLFESSGTTPGRFSQKKGHKAEVLTDCILKKLGRHAEVSVGYQASDAKAGEKYAGRRRDPQGIKHSKPISSKGKQRSTDNKPGPKPGPKPQKLLHFQYPFRNLGNRPGSSSLLEALENVSVAELQDEVDGYREQIDKWTKADPEFQRKLEWARSDYAKGIRYVKSRSDRPGWSREQERQRLIAKYAGFPNGLEVPDYVGPWTKEQYEAARARYKASEASLAEPNYDRLAECEEVIKIYEDEYPNGLEPDYPPTVDEEMANTSNSSAKKPNTTSEQQRGGAEENMDVDDEGPDIQKLTPLKSTAQTPVPNNHSEPIAMPRLPGEIPPKDKDLTVGMAMIPDFVYKLPPRKTPPRKVRELIRKEELLYVPKELQAFWNREATHTYTLPLTGQEQGRDEELFENNVERLRVRSRGERLSQLRDWDHPHQGPDHECVQYQEDLKKEREGQLDSDDEDEGDVEDDDNIDAQNGGGTWDTQETIQDDRAREAALTATAIDNFNEFMSSPKSVDDCDIPFESVEQTDDEEEEVEDEEDEEEGEDMEVDGEDSSESEEE